MKRSRCGEPPGGSLGNADPYEHTNYKLGGTGLIFKAGWGRGMESCQHGQFRKTLSEIKKLKVGWMLEKWLSG